ncbi:MAG: hypothetical protein ACM359_12475 [Bacillota bacterium]
MSDNQEKLNPDVKQSAQAATRTPEPAASATPGAGIHESLDEADKKIARSQSQGQTTQSNPPPPSVIQGGGSGGSAGQ